MATYEEAIKRAMASCPSNVPILQTIQVRHPALPTGDLWFVDRLTPRTCTLEDGSSLSECGLDPGPPGAEPDNPGSPPDDPGAAPTEPGNEPILSDYVYYRSTTAYSTKPFNRFGLVAETFDDWQTDYDLWQADIENPTLRNNAADLGEDCYGLDHAEWVTLTAAYDAWLVAKAIHDAWVAATALHDAWTARDAAYTAWLACIASETITQVFQPLAFEIKLASTGEHGIQDLSVTGCDVEGQFGDFVESVALSGSNVPISMTYRAYREDDLTTVQYLLEMSLSKARVTVYSFSARASVGDLINRAYLTENFTKERFPGLESRG